MVANAIIGGLSLLSSFMGGNSNSALLSEEANKRLMKYQQKLDRKTRQTSYQDTRTSLENAGYNPLLAVGQQANGGSYSSAMNVQDPNTERTNNLINSLSNFSQMKLNSANAYNQIQQGKLTNTQAYNLMTQAQLNSAQTGLTNLQQSAQAIQNLHLPKMLKSQILLNNNTAQANMINAQANQSNAVSNRMNAQTNSAVGASQIWSNYNPPQSSSVHIGPTGITYSKSGVPNKHNPTRQPYYTTEIINGKKVQVKNYK